MLRLPRKKVDPILESFADTGCRRGTESAAGLTMPEPTDSQAGLTGRRFGQGLNKTTMVEVLGRYSKIAKPSNICHFNTVRPVPIAAPRVHAVGRRLSAEIRQQLLADYQAGVSAKELARRYQLSRSSIRAVLRASGLPQRYQAMTVVELDQAVELYAGGSTIAEVASVLGRPYSTVQTALTQRSVAMRRRHDYA